MGKFKATLLKQFKHRQTVQCMHSEAKWKESKSHWHRGSHRNYLVWTTKTKLANKSRRESWELVWLIQGITFLLSHSRERVERRAGETWRNSDCKLQEFGNLHVWKREGLHYKGGLTSLSMTKHWKLKDKRNIKNMQKGVTLYQLRRSITGLLGDFSVDAVGPEGKKTPDIEYMPE